MRVRFSHEHERRVRLAAIGCGGHALRNIFSCYAFAPVDLVAVCDLDGARASQVARQYGAPASYTDYRRMLGEQRPEAVVVVTNTDENGRPRYPAIALDVLRAGAHAWIEKPPASSSQEVLAMRQAERESGRWVQVGFKKMFFPANLKARELMSREEFGRLRTISARYPQHLPGASQRGDDRAMQGFLDHIVHPLSLLRLLAGPVESILVEREAGGASFTTLRFTSGAIGSLHLAHGSSGLAPLERTEAVGEGATVIVENNLRVLFYPPGEVEGGYGRAASAYATSGAAQVWEPEFSLGQMYNKGLFLLGYAPQIIAFCEGVLNNEPPQQGSLDDALEILRLYEAFRRPDGERVRIVPSPGL